mmetsp:Transcript_71301/g.104480  ORF Transcript_71301/g.104480 Transcript_71301/m.104480 type:complete len:254 (-) Transcript_71301:288-1049(-)
MLSLPSVLLASPTGPKRLGMRLMSLRVFTSRCLKRATAPSVPLSSPARCRCAWPKARQCTRRASCRKRLCLSTVVLVCTRWTSVSSILVSRTRTGSSIPSPRLWMAKTLPTLLIPKLSACLKNLSARRRSLRRRVSTKKIPMRLTMVSMRSSVSSSRPCVESGPHCAMTAKWPSHATTPHCRAQWQPTGVATCHCAGAPSTSTWRSWAMTRTLVHESALVPCPSHVGVAAPARTAWMKTVRVMAWMLMAAASL